VKNDTKVAALKDVAAVVVKMLVRAYNQLGMNVLGACVRFLILF
jgi:hypothetical protein